MAPVINKMQINDLTDICITHSFCRHFKLLKVFFGRSESLLQDKSLKKTRRNKHNNQLYVAYIAFFFFLQH